MLLKTSPSFSPVRSPENSPVRYRLRPRGDSSSSSGGEPGTGGSSDMPVWTLQHEDVPNPRVKGLASIYEWSLSANHFPIRTTGYLQQETLILLSKITNPASPFLSTWSPSSRLTRSKRKTSRQTAMNSSRVSRRIQQVLEVTKANIHKVDSATSGRGALRPS